MVLAPQPHDDGIDLDRVDALRAVLQRRGHVGARARAEDQHVLEAVAEHLVRPLVEVLLLPDRRHRLVEDVVHLHHGFLALRVRGDLVVRRPQRVARQPVRHAERHGQAAPGPWRPTPAAAPAGTARPRGRPDRTRPPAATAAPTACRRRRRRPGCRPGSRGRPAAARARSSRARVAATSVTNSRATAMQSIGRNHVLSTGTTASVVPLEK